MNLEMRRGAGQGVGLWSSVAVSQRTCVRRGWEGSRDSGSWRATTGCQKKKFITTKTKGIEEATKEKTDMKNKD